MGASVLHEEAIFPVKDAGIPPVIKNTNAPDDPGTVISEETEPGVAGSRSLRVSQARKISSLFT